MLEEVRSALKQSLRSALKQSVSMDGTELLPPCSQSCTCRGSGEFLWDVLGDMVSHFPGVGLWPLTGGICIPQEVKM